MPQFREWVDGTYGLDSYDMDPGDFREKLFEFREEDAMLYGVPIDWRNYIGQNFQFSHLHVNAN